MCVGLCFSCLEIRLLYVETAGNNLADFVAQAKNVSAVPAPSRKSRGLTVDSHNDFFVGCQPTDTDVRDVARSCGTTPGNALGTLVGVCHIDGSGIRARSCLSVGGTVDIGRSFVPPSFTFGMSTSNRKTEGVCRFLCLARVYG